MDNLNNFKSWLYAKQDEALEHRDVNTYSVLSIVVSKFKDCNLDKICG